MIVCKMIIRTICQISNSDKNSKHKACADGILNEDLSKDESLSSVSNLLLRDTHWSMKLR